MITSPRILAVTDSIKISSSKVNDSVNYSLGMQSNILRLYPPLNLLIVSGAPVATESWVPHCVRKDRPVPMFSLSCLNREGNISLHV